MGLFKFTITVEAPSFEIEDVVTGISLVANHILVLVDAKSAVTITLPAVTDNDGVVYIFKKIDSSGNPVTIVGAIDGEQSVVLKLQFGYVTLACDEFIYAQWFIIGGINVKLEDLVVQQIDLLEQIRDGIEDSNIHLAEGSGEELNKEKD